MYELTVTETHNAAGKYHYRVIDENGKTVSERRSNRIYAACTFKGSNYFGRVDLAKQFAANNPNTPIAYLKQINVEIVYADHLPVTMKHKEQDYQLIYPLHTLEDEVQRLFQEGRPFFILEVTGNVQGQRRWIYAAIKQQS